jgi:two-component system phosphate regulon sensor histidine kinase PhoR
MKKKDILVLVGFVVLLTTIFLLFFSANTETIVYFQNEFISFSVSVFALILVLSYLFYILILAGTAKITDEEHKEQEIAVLKDNERYRKEFLGNVSHELKTPIFNIQGYVSTLMENDVKEEAVRKKFLERADNNINRLISIVNDLETITSLESGELKINKTAFSVAKLISEVMDMYENEAIKRLIHLEFPHKKSELKVRADREKIHAVISNLLSNAIHYGKEGGMAKIILKELDDTVFVYVMDDGIGIPADDQNRIFERFYRVDKSRSKEFGGTGLGLSIVKHIIDRHEQSLNLVSMPGEGSKFSFSLEKA